jgi:hypothetical protein
MKTNSDLIVVGIYIRGVDLDPDVITRRLGINPTRIQRKGEEKTSPSGSKYNSKIGLWGLLSDSTSLKISDHLSHLISKLNINGDEIRSLAGVEDAYFDIFVASSSDEDGEGDYGFEFSKESLSLLANVNLPVHFTHQLSKD